MSSEPDDILIDIDAAEEINPAAEIRAYDIPILERPSHYDRSLVAPEIVMFSSLLLVSAKDFVQSRGFAWEQRIENFKRKGLALCENAFASWPDQSRELGTYFIDDLLPDVCGTCFRFFGFMAGGNYRDYCSRCYAQPDISLGLAHFRYMELEHICWGQGNATSVFSQLIYKYHSPEGDRTWELKIPQFLKS